MMTWMIKNLHRQVTPDLPRVLCGTFDDTNIGEISQHKLVWPRFGILIENQNVGIPLQMWPSAAEKSKKQEQMIVADSTRKTDSGFSRPAGHGRPWLVVQDNLVFCSVCKEVTAADMTVGQKNSFVSGNAQFKLESIKLYEETRNHKLARVISVAKKTACEMPVAKFLFTLNSETMDKLTKLFKMCHALAKHKSTIPSLSMVMSTGWSKRSEDWENVQKLWISKAVPLPK